jgi:hypothetical protein
MTCTRLFAIKSLGWPCSYFHSGQKGAFPLGAQQKVCDWYKRIPSCKRLMQTCFLHSLSGYINRLLVSLCRSELEDTFLCCPWCYNFRPNKSHLSNSLSWLLLTFTISRVGWAGNTKKGEEDSSNGRGCCMCCPRSISSETFLRAVRAKKNGEQK